MACLLTAFATPPAVEAQLGLKDRAWIPGDRVQARNGEAVAVGDFNGDGIDDLAVGVPDETVPLSGGLPSAGRVRIHFGGPGGISSGSAPNQSFAEIGLIGGTSEAGDRFGAALAAADFDLDGVSDLAIGIPGQDMEGRENAGRVAVVYGTAGLGLDVFRVDFFDQRALIGGPETGDQFGATLAAGRLGIDPFPDLAVGVPGEAVSGFADVGAVNIVLSSGTAGLTDQGDQYLHQDVENVFGFASPGDRFGSALAIGDATGDGVGDLVVGTPGDLVGTTDGAGAVQVLPGAVDGVVISSDQVYWTQAVEGVLGAPGEGDEFGSALAFGRFNGDPHLDLAIGVPGESQFGPEESGAVQVLYGTPLGLSTFQSQVFFESLISPEVAVFDRFGDVLAAADFNADGFDELAIGLPRDNVLGVVNAGNVAVLRGAAAGLQSTGAQLWNGFFLLTLEAGDELGLSLATGRFSGGGACDLVIGVPGRESEGGLSQAGGVLIVRSEALLVDGFESGDLDAWSQVFP